MSSASDPLLQAEEGRPVTSGSGGYGSAGDQDDESRFREAFNKFDKDGNGTIEENELYGVMRELGHDVTEAQVSKLFARMDSDGNGRIEFAEFCKTAGAFELGNSFTADAVAGGLMQSINAENVLMLARGVSNPSSMAGSMLAEHRAGGGGGDGDGSSHDMAGVTTAAKCFVMFFFAIAILGSIAAIAVSSFEIYMGKKAEASAGCAEISKAMVATGALFLVGSICGIVASLAQCCQAKDMDYAIDGNPEKKSKLATLTNQCSQCMCCVGCCLIIWLSTLVFNSTILAPCKASNAEAANIAWSLTLAYWIYLGSMLCILPCLIIVIVMCGVMSLASLQAFATNHAR